MFVQLNPDVESYSETVSTLKFAERVSGVELGAAKSNKEGRGVKELMDQVLYGLFSYPFVLWWVRVPTLMPLSMMHSYITFTQLVLFANKTLNSYPECPVYPFKSRSHHCMHT